MVSKVVEMHFGRYADGTSETILGVNWSISDAPWEHFKTSCAQPVDKPKSTVEDCAKP